MRRFIKALSITVSLIVLQSVAQAQNAEDLMKTGSTAEVSIGEIASPNAAPMSIRSASLPLQEATIFTEDIAPEAAPRSEWAVELLPDFFPGSACAPRSSSVTILCWVRRL